MQRTFRSRFLSNSQQSYSISYRRTPSIYSKSPQQLLQLIKVRRARIKSNNQQHHSEIKGECKIELMLPKINSIKKQQGFSYEMLSENKYQSKNSQYQNQKYSTVDKTNLNSKISVQYNGQKSNTKNNQTISMKKHFPRSKTIEMHQYSQKLISKEQNILIYKGIQKLRNIMMKQHVNSNNKSIQYLIPIIDYLVSDNIIFKNLPKMMIFTIINKSKIRFYDANSWIYKKSDLLNSFFIILCGKVKIFNFNRQYKKISITGQTISEQILFMEWNLKNHRNEGAKSITDVFLLEIHYDVYLRLNKDLILQGYKLEFLTLETMIKQIYMEKKKLQNQN